MPPALVAAYVQMRLAVEAERRLQVYEAVELAQAAATGDKSVQRKVKKQLEAWKAEVRLGQRPRARPAGARELAELGIKHIHHKDPDG